MLYKLVPGKHLKKFFSPAKQKLPVTNILAIWENNPPTKKTIPQVRFGGRT